MITVMAGVALLALGSPDPEDPDDIIRTATAPIVSAESVAAEGRAAAEADTQSGPPAALQDPVPHGLTTDQQISRWLAEGPGVSSDVDLAQDGPVEGIAWDRERRVRSEFSVGIGTQGYRQFGASVSVPLGERGHLELHYREVENGYPVYGGYGYGYDPEWMDPVITPWRSEIGLAPVDARQTRSRAFGDPPRTRRAPESGR